MVGQVNPLGGLSPGLPPAPPPAAGSPRLTSEMRGVPTAAAEGAPRLSIGSGTGSPDAAMGQVNAHLQAAGSKLEFQVDKGSGRTVFKVVDQGSGKVVMQVPSEEMLAMARNVRALEQQGDASGVLINKEG